MVRWKEVQKSCEVGEAMQGGGAEEEVGEAMQGGGEEEVGEAMQGGGGEEVGEGDRLLHQVGQQDYT